jgi:Helicase conserved C-terminal domain
MRERFWHEWGEAEARVFSEKAFGRRSLTDWDAKWQQLTVRARHSFLHVVKLPDKNPHAYSNPPSAPPDSFSPDVLEELASAGFVRIELARSGSMTDRVFAGAGTSDFAWRGRILCRMHLLDAHQQSEFSKYVAEVFHPRDLLQVISGVLRQVGFEGYHQLDDVLKRHVTGHRWQEWITQAIDCPLAKPILNLVKESGGAMPMLELTGRIEGSEPNEVRSAVDQLIVHLALVEDFHPETWELMVGILPVVRERMTLASQPRRRPPLLVCPSPKEIAPQGSAIVNDLRAVLLEIANGPPRLRSDLALYQTERKRFLPSVEPLPAWLFEALSWSSESRLNEAVEWARTLRMVKLIGDGPNMRIHLAENGHQWLASNLLEQYVQVFKHFTTALADAEMSPSEQAFYDPGAEFSIHPVASNLRFFGEHLTVQKLDKRSPSGQNLGVLKQADQLSLRRHLERALAILQPGVFYRLDSVISHLALMDHNPLNLGLPPDRTIVSLGARSIPPFAEEREEAAQRLIQSFILNRLIPLGCVRAAIDDKGMICIAREATCELYFGHRIDSAALAPPSEAGAKVVVQPDFSVIVIGLNPASLAELTLFCERAAKGAGQGATVLKLTRASVVKAVRLGLKPEEIVARLKSHSSNALPVNVLREVKEWSSWVRRVTSSQVTVIRCGDSDTADRVMAVLKRKSERLSETTLAIDQAKLTAKEQDRLLGQGIIVQAVSDIREDDDVPETEDTSF